MELYVRSHHTRKYGGRSQIGGNDGFLLYFVIWGRFSEYFPARNVFQITLIVSRTIFTFNPKIYEANMCADPNSSRLKHIMFNCKNFPWCKDLSKHSHIIRWFCGNRFVIDLSKYSHMIRYFLWQPFCYQKQNQCHPQRQRRWLYFIISLEY